MNPTDWAYHVSVRLGGDAAYSFCMYAPDGAVDLADVTPIIGTVGDAIVAGPPGTEGPPGEGGADRWCDRRDPRQSLRF